MKMFFYFILTVALAGFSAKLTKGIMDVSSRIVSSISKDNYVVIGMHEATEDTLRQKY